MNTPFISYFLQMPSTPPYKCLTLQRLVLLTSDCFPGNTRHSLPYACDTQLVENSLIVFSGKITSGQSRLVLIVLTLRRARAHPLDSSVLVKALCKNKTRNVRGRSIIGIFVLFTEYTSFKSKFTVFNYWEDFSRLQNGLSYLTPAFSCIKNISRSISLKFIDKV